MSVVASPPSTAVRFIAVVTDSEEDYLRLVDLLDAGSGSGCRTEWVRNELAALRAVGAGQHDAWILDGRGSGGAAVQAALAACRGCTVVRLMRAGDPEPEEDGEWLAETDLTPERLRAALIRAARWGRLMGEVEGLRREREAWVMAQVQLETDKRRHEHLLRGIMQSLPLLLGRMDNRGRVVETHGAGLGRCGIEPEMLLRRRLGLALPEAREAVRQALLGQTATFTVRGRTGDTDWHADFVVMPEAGRDGGAIFLGRDVTERRWLEQQLLTASDAEQQRIGADLHDGLGQQLTGLACLVAALRDRLRAGATEDLAEQADFIVEVANDATRQSRALARGLCPVQLEGSSLELALEDLVYQAQQLHGVQCGFRSRGELAPFDSFTSIHLYRITQEALHNAVRHGLARNVWVTLVSRGTLHRLTIADDGRGFDSRQPAPVASRGLRLMNYRAGLIGGTLSIISRPGRGTRILCQFAYASALHEDPS